MRFRRLLPPSRGSVRRFRRNCRGRFAVAVGVKCLLCEYLASAADGLYPLAAVLIGGDVVEAERGVHARVGRNHLDRASSIGVHRADMHLVAVALGCGAVVTDRDR